jgi:tRNA 2-selenouridine synthase
MTKTISIEVYFDLNIPLLDVRTPLEFAQGHVPGAFNLPIFSNEERVQVGSTYKQQSREDAILLGFDLAGPKWSGFIREALLMAPEKRIAVQCWRGGMRSGAMAWALGLYGFEVYTIAGGYKTYRRWALDQFEKPWRLTILGGLTGSGKTKILHELQTRGEQVIDLEDLAQHQGSAFGTMNRLVQPTQEQFENDFAYSLQKQDPAHPIWVEDESLTIGKRVIPGTFWKNMRSSQLIKLQIPDDMRIAALVEEYGKLDRDFLIECTTRVRKRLGPEQTKHAIAAINEGRMADFIRLLLVYYDKNYERGLGKRSRDRIFSIECQGSIEQTAQTLKAFAGKLPVTASS